VVSCFTPFKKVLFFHTKSLKEKKRERKQGENVGILQILSKFYKSYSSKMQVEKLVKNSTGRRSMLFHPV
jgi:hypothetical protein